MYDKIIEAGIIILLIYTPLAFGGVLQGSVALMEILVGLLLLVWLAKLFSRRRHFSYKPGIDAEHYHLRLISPSFLLPLCFLIALVVFQLIPLPGFLLRIVSPSSYQLYAEASGNLHIDLPGFLPLSVCVHATETELFKLLTYVCVFLLCVNNIRSPQQVKHIVYVIIAVGLFESLYGLLEYFSGRHQIFFYKKTSSLTVSGTFVNKNHFAGYLEMVIPLTFSLLFIRLEERSQTGSKKILRIFDDKYMKVALVGFLLAIMMIALLLSGSRGGVVSFAGGMLCLMTLAYNRHVLRKRVLIILLLVLIALGLAVSLGHELITTRLQTLTNLEAEISFQLRREIWKDTLSMFHDFPIFGAGLGTFSRIYPQYQSFPSDLRVEYTENDYLQLLAETGVLGGILVGCIIALFFYTTLKAWKHRQARWSIVFTAGGISALAGMLLHSFIDFNLHMPSNAFLFTVIAALSSVASHSQRRTPK
ncbi:MAG: hypothetical protein GY801_02040 [bacterium]|nr:hypothetical protein [bacterium]